MGRHAHDGGAASRGRRAVWAALLACEGCVVVSDADVGAKDPAGDSTTDGTTSGDPMTSWSPTSAGGSDDPGGTDDPDDPHGTGSDGGPLSPTAFPVYWAVTPADVEVPVGDDAAVDVDHAVHIVDLPPPGTTPASIDDLPGYLDSWEEALLAAIDPDAPPGLVVVPNQAWWVPWCGATDDDHIAFAASPLGRGLTPRELPAAWEAAAVAVWDGVFERGRAVLPQMQWGFAGIRIEYWDLVSVDPDRVAEYRQCHLLSPAATAAFEGADVVVPFARYFYTGVDDALVERNALFVKRMVEGARVTGKPVIPLLEGRYNRSSDTDENPYMWLPLLQDDVARFLTGSRSAGAHGFIYAFEADGCWNYDEGCDAPDPDAFDVLFEAYWNELVAPVVEPLQPADG